MENTEKTKIYNLVILDKSGSMGCIRDAAISGFNETLGGIRSAQKEFSDTQEHFVSLLTFCSCSKEYLYKCTPVEKVKNLIHQDYQPCCGTPLYDAMGKALNDMQQITENEDEAAVIVTVITDGMENASREFSGKQIKELVDMLREKYGWNFSYIGTNQDVEAEAAKLSITNTMSFSYDNEGMGAAWDKETRSRGRFFYNLHFLKTSCDTSAEKRIERMHSMLRKDKRYHSIDEFANRTTPFRITNLEPGQIFVFGSNAAGHHGGGAAYQAMERFGAIYGQGDGLQGQSYAISTMEGKTAMRDNVYRFIKFAHQHPELTFLVTRIGCGIAGYTPSEVAPLFSSAVEIENIWLPKDFWEIII
jgi:hypothetical protein